jgi:hypothetical protein
MGYSNSIGRDHTVTPPRLVIDAHAHRACDQARLKAALQRGTPRVAAHGSVGSEARSHGGSCCPTRQRPSGRGG